MMNVTDLRLKFLCIFYYTAFIGSFSNRLRLMQLSYIFAAVSRSHISSMLPLTDILMFPADVITNNKHFIKLRSKHALHGLNDVIVP